MINTLPDNVLLDTFDLCRMDEVIDSSSLPWKWYRLAHVCRTWRDIIFASSCRLKLELLCTNGTLVRKDLGHLPTLPLVIFFPNYCEDSDEDNIMAALDHPNRVHVLELPVSGSLLGKMAIITEPFPALTDLSLKPKTDEPMPVLPDAFLGGNTPRLQNILLDGIPFPAVPTLLSSARDLVNIDIHDIPSNGYISPEAIVASLAVLPRMSNLTIGFQRGTSYPHRIRTPPILAPITRTVLPSLESFEFAGLFEYLEDLVAQIDAPQLDSLVVEYLDKNEDVDFQIPEFRKFINRSETFRQHQFRRAGLNIDDYSVTVEFDGGWKFRISILGGWVGEMLSQISGMLSNVYRLDIFTVCPGLLTEYDEPGHSIRWPELLRTFTAVKALSVLSNLSHHVVLALNSFTGESAAEVLPAVELLCLENEKVTRVKGFFATRRNLGRPVTFVNSTTEFKIGLKLIINDRGLPFSVTTTTATRVIAVGGGIY